MQSSKTLNKQSLPLYGKSYESNKTYETYIQSFSLASPQWEDFPMELLHLNEVKLPDEERHVLSAIKLEYFYEHLEEIVGTKVKRMTFYSFVISLISLIGLIGLILFSINGEKISQPVSAATVERGYATVSATLKQIDIKNTIYDVYESTRSAIFK